MRTERLWLSVPELLVVTPTYFPELVGTPHYVTDLVQWLEEAGWEVRVLTSQPYYPDFQRFAGYGRHRRFDRVGQTNIYRLPTIVPKAGSGPWRGINEANFLVQGLIAIARGTINKCATVLSVSPGTPGAVVLGRHLTARGGRHVALIHDIQAGLAEKLGMIAPPLMGSLRRFERFAFDQADELNVLSVEMGDAVRSLGVRRDVTVSPLWTTIPRHFPSPKQAALVQYSGNLGRKQGVDQLVSLARALADSLPGERLLVRGAGAMSTLLHKARNENALTNLTFAPLVPHDQLAQALASSPIHVVPQQEGCADYVVPSKVINALAAGSVVIAAAPANSALARLAVTIPSLRRVPPGNVKAMAHETYLLASDRSALDTLCRETNHIVAQTFDRDRIIQQLANSLTSPSMMSLNQTTGSPE